MLQRTWRFSSRGPHTALRCDGNAVSTTGEGGSRCGGGYSACASASRACFFNRRRKLRLRLNTLSSAPFVSNSLSTSGAFSLPKMDVAANDTGSHHLGVTRPIHHQELAQAARTHARLPCSCSATNSVQMATSLCRHVHLNDVIHLTGQVWQRSSECRMCETGSKQTPHG